MSIRPPTRNLPLLDVETQIHLAQQSGKLSGPGYDIEALKRAGLVLPDKTSPIGVKPASTTRKTIGMMPDVTQLSGLGEPTGTPQAGLKPGPAADAITIRLTQAERNAATAKAAAAACPGDAKKFEIRTYKVTLKGGGYILVESVGFDKSKAKSIAEDAGYKVAWVTWSPSYTEPAATTPAQEVSGTQEERENLVKLDSGEWVKKEFYDPLPDASKAKLNALGVAGYNEWLTAETQRQVDTSGNQYLINAYRTGSLDGYNRAVDEYNTTVSDAEWYHLYNTYKASADKEWGKEGWDWFQKTYSDKLSDKKYMDYLQSDEFRDHYASVVQPAAMSDADYNLIKPFINPEGFDAEAAYQAGADNPTTIANIMKAANQFTLETLSDESMDKINRGEWTLLPFGQVIETEKLNRMPPTNRQIVENVGLVGYEAYQDKVLEFNRQEHWFKNTADAIVSQAVGLGQDIKNFALLQLSGSWPEVKEGDPKPLIDPTGHGMSGIGPGIGALLPDTGTYTAEEAAAVNAKRAATQKYWKDLYEEAELAAQEWHARRPQLQPVYAEGFVDAVKKNPASLKDPLLWTETIANTLPYTVATGLIVAGGTAGGAGVAATAPLAFAITMSVEGHDIYKDAINNGAAHDQALKLANTYGAISASIETIGDSVFVGVFGTAAGAFSKALGKNTSANIIRGAAKRYGWKKLTVDMIKDFVNQGGQEFLQEVVHNAAIKTVNENQALLDNTANAFVSGVIGTAPFVLIPAGGQAITRLETRIQDARVGKPTALAPANITPQIQFKILNKVFAPVSGFTVKTTAAEEQHITKALPEMALRGGPVEWAKRIWGERGRNIYEARNSISVGLIDKKTVITGKANVDEVALAYSGMCARVNEYANIQLTLKQAQQAISDFGLAKSKKQLETLNEYKKRAAELEAELKELKGPMVEAVENFSKTFLKNSKGLEAEQKAEVREMAKTIVTDIDNVTTQLFGERNAREIAKDIKELETQIQVIEEEMAGGMTREQLEGYARLVGLLRGQVGDLVNELRQRYLAEGEKIKPDTKKLAMEVMSLQARLTKAVESLQNFTGSALNYDVHRKGELARQANIVRLERDTFEAIQKTTEAIWGRESYGEVLEKLNNQLSAIIDSMQSLQAKKRATKAAFKIYDAIKKQDAKQLKAGVRLLQLEAGRITDKPLQLQTAQQVKLLETLTTENFWERFQEKKTQKKVDEDWWYSSNPDFEAERRAAIIREAEQIISKRWETVLKSVPSYMMGTGISQPYSQEQIMEYLRSVYDKAYFEDHHGGQFQDLDDYLDVDKEVERIYQEDLRQAELQGKRLDLERAERERDLARNLRDNATKPKWRGILDNAVNEREREVERKKEDLKTITKTKVVIPAEKPVETTKSQEERGVAVAQVKEDEKKIEKDKEATAAEKAKAEARAAQRIRIAKKQVAEEEAKKEEEEKASAFPGIKPKTKARAGLRYADIEYALAQYYTLTGAKAGTKAKLLPKTAIQQAIEAGLQAQAAVQTRTRAQTKTQAQLAAKAQTRPAVQTAVQAALKAETKTATKEEIETATETITEVVTKTKYRPTTLTPPWRPKTEPIQGRQRRPHEEPPLAVWRQGMYWVSVYPPFRTTGGKPDVVYSRHKPPMGKVVTGRRSPSRSLRTTGRLPQVVELPMGVVTARIKHGQRLTFSRDGRRRRRRK